MNELKVVARLLAQERGEAVRLTRERSYPLSDQPMVLVPIVMAGASPSLFALGIGDGIKPCHVHVCAEPRNRDQQYETLSRAASDMERFLHVWETDPEVMPQLITSGADASRLCLVTIHRMTYAQDLRIRLVGRRLHWLDRVFEQPESTALLDMPRAICELFATGQDECADAHLGAVLEWLKPADGQIYDRVLRVEDSPVSTATDPRLDNGKLIPLLQAVGQAEEKGDSSSSNRRRAEIKRIFHEEVGRRYDLIRQALSVCRRFPGSAGADYIQHQDRARYERNLAYVANPENLLATGLSGNAATSTFLARELRAEHLEGLMLRSVSGLPSVARLSGNILVGKALDRGVRNCGRKTVVHYQIRSAQERLSIRRGDNLTLVDDLAFSFRVLDFAVDESGETVVTLELTGGKTKPGQPQVGDQLELAEPLTSPERIARTMRLARERLSVKPPAQPVHRRLVVKHDYLSGVRKMRSAG
jgi:hypothetical protein